MILLHYLERIAKGKGYYQKAFQTDKEIRRDCAKRYHVSYINCAEGILFGVLTVLNVITFLLICHLLSLITR